MELPMLKLIREHLGLEIGEKFKLRNYTSGEIVTNSQHEEVVYHFEENALCIGDGMRVAEGILHPLVYRYVQIVRVPFKPKFSEKFWTYVNDDWDIGQLEWLNFPSDFVMFKSGMVFRTKQEALDARPKLYKEYMGMEWDDGKETN